MNYQELAKYFISTATISAATVWLVKKIISDFISKNYYKFSKLHDEQCQFIKKIYSDIYLLKTKYDELHFHSRDKYEKYTDFRDNHLSEFVTLFNSSSLYYNSNKILIPIQTKSKIDELFYLIDKGILETSIGVIWKVSNNQQLNLESKEYFDNADEISKIKIPKILDILEKDFRQIYGVK